MGKGEIVQDGQRDEGNERAIPRSRYRSLSIIEAGAFDSQTRDARTLGAVAGDSEVTRRHYPKPQQGRRCFKGEGRSLSRWMRKRRNVLGVLRRKKDEEEREEEMEGFVLCRGTGNRIFRNDIIEDGNLQQLTTKRVRTRRCLNLLWDSLRLQDANAAC